jgi:hypothetical protein
VIALAVDVILGLVVLEAVALAAWHRATGTGFAPRAILGTLASGFLLMLATRLAIGEAGAGPIAACLFAALLAHLTDLALRWRGGAPR